MEIRVVVTPNARVNTVAKIGENIYKVRVDAPATEGRANNRMIELLSEYFDVSKNQIRLIRGATSRNKVVHVEI